MSKMIDLNGVMYRLSTINSVGQVNGARYDGPYSGSNAPLGFNAWYEGRTYFRVGFADKTSIEVNMFVKKGVEDGESRHQLFEELTKLTN